MIKCSASLAFYLFSSTHLINSIKHEHSCKILYLTHETFSYFLFTSSQVFCENQYALKTNLQVNHPQVLALGISTALARSCLIFRSTVRSQENPDFLRNSHQGVATELAWRSTAFQQSSCWRFSALPQSFQGAHNTSTAGCTFTAFRTALGSALKTT